MTQKNKEPKPNAISYVYIASAGQGDDNPGLCYAEYLRRCIKSKIYKMTAILTATVPNARV